jgi:type IV pilus assembly protein PilW
MRSSKMQCATPRRERGMSLIEILVGVLIGMIGIVVIFQVLAVSEQQKRNTTHGADAQSSGAIGLFAMQEDVQLGGYGLGMADDNQIGCMVDAYNDAVTPKAVDFPLIPLEVVQGAAGAPDQIRVLYGNSPYFVANRSFTASTSTSKTLDSAGRAGIEVGDKVVFVTQGAAPSCMLVQITAKPGAVGSSTEVDHTDDGNPFNKGGSVAGAFPSPAAGFAFNLGPGPHRNVWRITTAADAQGPNRLVVSDATFGDGTVIEVSDGIINLQAEYGVDANGNNFVEDNEWTATTPVGANWRKLRAVRVALLARSAQWDKTACSPNPQWTSGDGLANLTLTDFVMTDVDGTAATASELACTENPPSPNNWRRYRYSVYETVIPLRNMIWGTAP